MYGETLMPMSEYQLRYHFPSSYRSGSRLVVLERDFIMHSALEVWIKSVVIDTNVV